MDVKRQHKTENDRLGVDPSPAQAAASVTLEVDARRHDARRDAQAEELSGGRYRAPRRGVDGQGEMLGAAPGYGPERDGQLDELEAARQQLVAHGQDSGVTGIVHREVDPEATPKDADEEVTAALEDSDQEGSASEPEVELATEAEVCEVVAQTPVPDLRAESGLDLQGADSGGGGTGTLAGHLVAAFDGTFSEPTGALGTIVLFQEGSSVTGRFTPSFGRMVGQGRLQGQVGGDGVLTCSLSSTVLGEVPSDEQVGDAIMQDVAEQRIGLGGVNQARVDKKRRELTPEPQEASGTVTITKSIVEGGAARFTVSWSVDSLPSFEPVELTRQAGAEVLFGGTWADSGAGDWGTVTLEQEGDRVWGGYSYVNEQGTQVNGRIIQGRASGNVVRAEYWEGDGAINRGVVYLTRGSVAGPLSLEWQNFESAETHQTMLESGAGGAGGGALAKGALDGATPEEVDSHVAAFVAIAGDPLRGQLEALVQSLTEQGHGELVRSQYQQNAHASADVQLYFDTLVEVATSTDEPTMLAWWARSAGLDDTRVARMHEILANAPAGPRDELRGLLTNTGLTYEQRLKVMQGLDAVIAEHDAREAQGNDEWFEADAGDLLAGGGLDAVDVVLALEAPQGELRTLADVRQRLDYWDVVTGCYLDVLAASAAAMRQHQKLLQEKARREAEAHRDAGPQSTSSRAEGIEMWLAQQRKKDAAVERHGQHAKIAWEAGLAQIEQARGQVDDVRQNTLTRMRATLEGIESAITQATSVLEAPQVSYEESVAAADTLAAQETAFAELCSAVEGNEQVAELVQAALVTARDTDALREEIAALIEYLGRSGWEQFVVQMEAFGQWVAAQYEFMVENPELWLQAIVEIAALFGSGGLSLAAQLMLWLGRLGKLAAGVPEFEAALEQLGELEALYEGRLDDLGEMLTLGALGGLFVGLLFGQRPSLNLGGGDSSSNSSTTSKRGKGGKLAKAVGALRKHAASLGQRVDEIGDTLDLTRFPWLRELAVAGAAAVAVPGVLSQMDGLDGSLGELSDAITNKVAELDAAIDAGLKQLGEAAANPAEVIADAQDMLSEVVAGLLVRSGPAVVQIALHGAGIDRNNSEQINATLNAMTGGSWTESVGDALGGLGLDALEGHLVELVELLEHWSGNLEALVSEVSTMAQSHLSSLEGFDSMFVQRSATNDGSMAVDATSERAMAASQGQRLEPVVQAEMEQRFGADFSQVRIHTDSHAATASDRLQANAMARGKDVYFAAGKYDPQSTQGKRLLAHELAHTVQDGAAPKKQAAAPVSDAPQGVRRKARTSAPGDATERQADAAADQVVGGQQVTALGGGGQTNAVKRQESELAGRFASELTDLGKTIGGWEALLEGLDGPDGQRIGQLLKQFKSELGSRTHGAALVEPLLRDANKAIAELGKPLNTYDVTSPGLRLRFDTARWRSDNEDVSADAGAVAPVVVPTDEWRALVQTYSVASFVRWAASKLDDDTLRKKLTSKTFSSALTQPWLDAEGLDVQPGRLDKTASGVRLSWDAAAQQDLRVELTEALSARQREWTRRSADQALLERYASLLGGFSWTTGLQDRSEAVAQLSLSLVQSRADLDVRGLMSARRSTDKALRDRIWRQLLESMGRHLSQAIESGPMSQPGDGGSAELAAALAARVELDEGAWTLRLQVVDDLLAVVGDSVEQRMAEFTQRIVVDTLDAGFSLQSGHESLLRRPYDFNAAQVAEREGVVGQIARLAADDDTITTASNVRSHLANGHDPLRTALYSPVGESLVTELEATLRPQRAQLESLGLDADEIVYEAHTDTLSGSLVVAGWRLGKRKPAKAHEALVAVAGGGSKILGFLRKMAHRQTASGGGHEVSWDEFSGATNPKGFEYVAEGRQQNKEKVKDWFRAADKGKHEWIPSDQILNVVRRSQASAAQSADEIADGGIWLETQHSLRSHTEDIIFSPYVDAREEFGKFGRKVQDWAAGLRVLLKKMSADDFDPATVTPEQLKFQGHSGALYEQTGAKGGRTKSQNEWHEELRTKFKASDSVNTAITQMHAFAKKTVWDGVFKPAIQPDVLVQVKVDLMGSDGNPLAIDHIGGKTTASDRRQEILEEKISKSIRDQVGELDETISTLLGLSERQKVAFKRVGEDFTRAQTEVDANE